MNYVKLFEDVRSGEFDAQGGGELELVMDNDGGYWIGTTEDYDKNEQLAALAEERYGSPNGYKDIVDVINAAGVSCDWC